MATANVLSASRAGAGSAVVTTTVSITSQVVGVGTVWLRWLRRRPPRGSMLSRSTLPEVELATAASAGVSDAGDRAGE
jgi:hypothetical protein